MIDPAKIEFNELNKFDTSLREVMGYIKYSKDKESLAAFLNGNSRVWIERSAAQVIKAITKTPIDIPEGVEEINMCEAIEAMVKDSNFAMLAGLVKDGLLSLKDAAKRLNMSEDDFKAAMEKMN